MGPHMFSPLPSPSGASREFLHQIGLEPEPFQKWLRSIEVRGTTYGSRHWSDVLRLYATHCEEKWELTRNENDDPHAEMRQFGLTHELCDKIVKTAGEHYEAWMPIQYVVSAVETTLAMTLCSREGLHTGLETMFTHLAEVEEEVSSRSE